MNKGMYSSRTDNWETPQELFDELNDEFNFTLDPCATKENAKCEQYFTKENDGLTKDWWRNKSVFMNPPYGRIIGDWMKKAHETAQHGTTVVCLVPARTDTKWFHEYCLEPKYEIRWIKGRLKFGDSKNSAPFPSCIVIMRGVK